MMMYFMLLSADAVDADEGAGQAVKPGLVETNALARYGGGLEEEVRGVEENLWKFRRRILTRECLDDLEKILAS